MKSVTTKELAQILDLIMDRLRSETSQISYLAKIRLEKGYETSFGSMSVSNDLVYVDESEICLKTPFCSALTTKDPTLSIESIRFFTTRSEDLISVYAGINICVRPELLRSLELSSSLEFEFPDEERRAFDLQYGEIRWHQDAFFEVNTIEEVVDKLILTVLEISRQW